MKNTRDVQGATHPAPECGDSGGTTQRHSEATSAPITDSSTPLTFEQRVELLKERQKANRAHRKFKTKKQKPETGLHQRIKATLRLYPWARLERNNRKMSGHHMYGLETPGSSDFVGGVTMDSGFERTTVLEVKMPGESPTAEQQAYIDEINHRGGYGRVVYSTDEAVLAIHESRNGVRL